MLPTDGANFASASRSVYLDAEVFLEDTLDLGLQFLVTLGAPRKALGIGTLGQMVIESGWGNRQQTADWAPVVLEPSSIGLGPMAPRWTTARTGLPHDPPGNHL